MCITDSKHKYMNYVRGNVFPWNRDIYVHTRPVLQLTEISNNYIFTQLLYSEWRLFLFVGFQRDSGTNLKETKDNFNWNYQALAFC